MNPRATAPQGEKSWSRKEAGEAGSAETDQTMSGLIRERNGKRMEKRREQEKRKKILQIQIMKVLQGDFLCVV